MPRTLVWFRNDLRLHDNEVLVKASEMGEVLLLYCFDMRHFKKTSFGFQKTGAFRAQFLIESVQNLKDNLKGIGVNLVVRIGHPEEIIPQLLTQFNINQVYAHKEITEEEVDVENALASKTKVPVKYFWGSTLYHINDIGYSQGSIPDVFTSFRKKIEVNSSIRSLFSAPKVINPIKEVREEILPSLTDLGLERKFINTKSVFLFKGGEEEALKRLSSYIWEKELIKTYKFTRNGLLGADYSSKFSPWLANGSLSPRQVYKEVKKYEEERVQNKSTYWLIFELIWRDYFRFSSWKFGNKIFQLGGIHGKERNWDSDKEAFDKWKNGRTGIPFIDANMNELNQTGFMSNRGRQNVASFLAQNLNVDWRMGAEYFESMLLDYDPCSNYGNWAYNATLGHDPRNRYFNILLQADRYDKKGEYVRYWLSELKHVPSDFVHVPHTIPVDLQKLYELEVGVHYPKPMIDLEQSYEEIKKRN